MPREKKEKFEDALQKLEKIVSQLAEGDISLEESLKLFEERTRLSRFCNQKLNEAEKKVEVLLKDKDGELIGEPFDPSRNPGQGSSSNSGQFAFKYSDDSESEKEEQDLMNITKYLQEKKEVVDKALENYLPKQTEKGGDEEFPASLRQAYEA